MTEVIYYRVTGDPEAQAPDSVHKICIHCNNEVFFLMTKNQYDRWKINGEYIQSVFPHLDVHIREWMISGTHPACWEDLFGPSDQLD